jgi:hypothetical protein
VRRFYNRFAVDKIFDERLFKGCRGSDAKI